MFIQGKAMIKLCLGETVCRWLLKVSVAVASTVWGKNQDEVFYLEISLPMRLSSFSLRNFAKIVLSAILYIHVSTLARWLEIHDCRLPQLQYNLLNISLRSSSRRKHILQMLCMVGCCDYCDKRIGSFSPWHWFPALSCILLVAHQANYHKYEHF